MKQLVIIIIMTFLSLASLGQSFKAIFFNPNVYRTEVDLKATRLIDKKLKTLYNDTFLIKVSDLGHLDYKIVNEDDNGYVIIRVLPKVKLFTETLAGDSKKTVNVVRHTENEVLKSDSTNAYNYYFSIKKDNFRPLAKTLLSKKIIGIPLVQPFKLRPGKGSVGWDLGGEFTLSYNFGLRLKSFFKNPFSQNFISIVPYGFGVGASKYFKENTDGTLTEKSDAFAVTYYQGGLLLTMQKVNFGIFTGLDAMIDRQNNWFYQSEPWLSFGLGYKFKED